MPTKNITIVGYCGNCGEAIYEGQECMEDENTGRLYCDEDCALQDMEIKDVDSDEQFTEICPISGEVLTEEYECVEYDGIKFLDKECVLEYIGIKEVIA